MLQKFVSTFWQISFNDHSSICNDNRHPNIFLRRNFYLILVNYRLGAPNGEAPPKVVVAPNAPCGDARAPNPACTGVPARAPKLGLPIALDPALPKVCPNAPGGEPNDGAVGIAIPKGEPPPNGVGCPNANGGPATPGCDILPMGATDGVDESPKTVGSSEYFFAKFLNISSSRP